MPEHGRQHKIFPHALLSGLRDLQGAWARRRVAAYFAWTDTFARYRRSLLGPLWLVLGTLVGVVGLGVVWSVLLNVPINRFIPTLTVGLIAWQFMSSTISEASGVFQRNAPTITSIYVPRFSFTLELVLRQLVTFGHNCIVVALVWVAFPEHWTFVMLLAGLGFVIVVANLLPLAQLIGFLGARYRDVEPLILAVMPMLFFLTPILYDANQLGPLQQAMHFNPLSHWIAVLRDPMMGIYPSMLNYFVAIASAAVLWLAALWTTGAKGARLAYWL